MIVQWIATLQCLSITLGIHIIVKPTNTTRGMCAVSNGFRFEHKKKLEKVWGCLKSVGI